MTRHRRPSDVRSQLAHPVIDADGHWLEFPPVFSEQLRRIGGTRAAEGFLSCLQAARDGQTLSVAERRRRRIAQEPFWSRPERNTRDRATAMLPGLLYERLDELGFDFAVIYPTAGLNVPRIADGATRRDACRAFNVLTAEYFHRFSDRITPAAVIPLHTPEEAIEELGYSRRQLGFRVAMFASAIPRPVPSVSSGDAEVARFAVWHDVLGLDSEHAYDPLWAACLDLGIAPTFHSGSRRLGFRLSPTNFTYNHIGHFAAAGEAVCKALVLGGVTRRFPGLNFAFLEGGVGWACLLYEDLVGHWHKRNGAALAHTDPRALDRALLMTLVRKYGDDAMAQALQKRDGWPDPHAVNLTGDLPELDDFAACTIASETDWSELFARPFYFGCEADARTTAWAFRGGANVLGARLNAVFGSDIGHFDVPDMLDVLPEAHERVEDGSMTGEDFRDFTFANAVRLWGGQNPAFFDGTVVAKAAAAVLAERRARE